MARVPDIGAGTAAVGLIEAASNLGGDSLIDRVGDVLVANTPLPLVEETIKRLGVTDKPVLRANVGLMLAAAIGTVLPGRRSLSSQVALAGAGLAAAAAGRVALNRAEVIDRDLELPVVEPLGPVTDGAEDWPNAEPLFTDPERFYQTDINLRPPAIDIAAWALAVETPGGAERITFDRLAGLGLRERDAVLACVHNRPGWDRLGQQRWTGVPLDQVLGAAGGLPDEPSRYDLVTEAVDGYSQVLPLELALERDSWVVIGMAGEPLTKGHGFPARLMTPGIVGQYNGVKWMSRLAVVPAGSEQSWWVQRRSVLGEPGWPSEPVFVKPMARIDHPANTGMPPRLPPRPVTVAAGEVQFTGTAWAPSDGVAAVDVRLDGGEWRECELAGEINADSWRRWRAELDLAPGAHEVQARCHSRSGAVQAGAPDEPFPLGSGAFHTVALTAT